MCKMTTHIYIYFLTYLTLFFLHHPHCFYCYVTYFSAMPHKLSNRLMLGDIFSRVENTIYD